MTISGWAAFAAYGLTVTCSVVVAKRSSNWRIRLLAYTIGLLPLCQAVSLLGRNKVWITSEVGQVVEMLELLVSALSLTSIHLLNRENGDCKKTDVRLRVTETNAGTPAPRQEQPPVQEGWEVRRTVERRREPRFIADMPVTVTVLGTAVPQVIPARVQDMSGHGLCLGISSSVPNGAAVKVEGDGMLLLGEVCRCEPVGSEYRLGLQISEWLDLPTALTHFALKRDDQGAGNANRKSIGALELELLEDLTRLGNASASPVNLRQRGYVQPKRG